MTMTRRTVLTTAAALAAASWSGLTASAEKSKSIVIFFSRTGTIKGLAQTVVKLTGSRGLTCSNCSSSSPMPPTTVT